MTQQLIDALYPGARVFVPGMSGESTLLLCELEQFPEKATGVNFVGVQFPGIGRADYIKIHPHTQQTAFFMSPSVRQGISEQRANLLAMDYSAIARYLQQGPKFDLAVGHFSLPDAQGWCSAGISHDFLPVAWPRADRRIAQLNPEMPHTASGFRVHISEIDIAVEHASPPTEFTEAAGNMGAIAQIGALAAEFVRDGDTLQFGIGAVPLALVQSLRSHRSLRLHTGMVSPAIRKLHSAGALNPDAPIVTGVALGDTDFYDWVAHHPNFHFDDVRITHDVHAISAIPRFIAINSAVEVDLFGQVNSERSDGRLAAGAGGLPAFAQGALASQGGRVLICMAATARNGQISRIVPALTEAALCTLPRHMADVVITEHGAVELRNLSMDARAQALIGIAAPEFRSSLEVAWGALRDQL